MSGKNRYKARCLKCRMHMELCVCELFPKFDLKTRVTALLHYREFARQSNTGHFISKVLTNSEMVVRHFPVFPEETSRFLVEGYETVVMYPGIGATEISRDWFDSLDKPLHLIIPDGSWREAGKLINRDPQLKVLPRVCLPVGPPTQYHLREERRENGLATFEALARVLGIIEDQQKVQLPLEEAFRKMTHRTLWARGQHKKILGSDLSL